MTHESVLHVFDITPLTVPVLDLQSCDWLAPYCRETRVVYNNHHMRNGYYSKYRQVITCVTLHPDIVSFNLFFLGAGVAESKYVSSSSWNWSTQKGAVLKHKSP